MTMTINATDLDMHDDGSGPVTGRITCVVANDDPAAVALGVATKVDVRAVYCPRAAWNAFLGTLRRPPSDAWPDGTLPHVVARGP
jgi:hypothetical protein